MWMKNKSTFSNLLIKYRERLNLKKAALAAKIGVTQPTISKFENPKNDVLPKYETLVKLCSALNLTDVEETEFIDAGHFAKVSVSSKNILKDIEFKSFLKQRLGPFIDDEETAIIFSEQPVVNILNALIKLTEIERSEIEKTIIGVINGVMYSRNQK